MIGDKSPAGNVPAEDVTAERMTGALRRLSELVQGSMLDAALIYASAGWPVFPCNPKQREGGKRPLVAGADKDEHGKPIPKTGGLWRASTDEAQIRAWWGRYPKALIGVPTGARIGLFVVDLDPRDGETVDEVLARLEAVVGPLPYSPVSVTQSGGRHIWLKNAAGADLPKNSAARIPGVDWRGEGGYVIVPPSVMSDGKAYSWLVAPQ